MIGPMQWGKEVVFNFALPNGGSSEIPGRFPMIGILPDPSDPSNGWSSIKFIDVNGDGLTDVVYIQKNHVAQVFLNCAGKALLGPIPLEFVADYHPNDQQNPTILR